MCFRSKLLEKKGPIEAEPVNRSLIQPECIQHDGKAGYFRVHDTILDFLIGKSSEENFCTVGKK
jgi:hypothetical protein